MLTGFWEIKDPKLGESIAEVRSTITCKGILQIEEDQGELYRLKCTMAGVVALVNFPFNLTLMSGMKKALSLQYGKKNDMVTRLKGVSVSHPLLESEQKIDIEKLKYSSEIEILEEIEFKTLPEAKKVLTEKLS